MNSNDTFMIFLIAAIGVFVALALGLRLYLDYRRQKAFRALAKRLGLRYRPGKDYDLVHRFRFLNDLRQGENRYATNIIYGPYDGHPVTLFDFHYETYTHTKNGRQTHHHHQSFFVLHLPRAFPELRIYPENMLSKLGQMLGYGDIDFESVEFSKAFTVRSKDKKFAYDICHPRMMEYLLDHPYITIEIERDAFATCSDGLFSVEAVERRLKVMLDLRQLFPRYLFEPAAGSVS